MKGLTLTENWLQLLQIEKKRSPRATREVWDQMNKRNKSLRRFRELGLQMIGRFTGVFITEHITTLLQAHFSHLISGKVHPITLRKALKPVVPLPLPTGPSFQTMQNLWLVQPTLLFNLLISIIPCEFCFKVRNGKLLKSPDASVLESNPA